MLYVRDYEGNTKGSLGSCCGSVGRAVLPIPEVRGSNPVIGKVFILNINLLLNVLKKKKEAGN